MNNCLECLLSTGDMIKCRTLAIRDNETDKKEYYVTEYHMNSPLGPFVWYCTWKAPECEDKELWLRGSFYKN